MAEIVSWLWDYGNGDTSNEELPPVYRYREPGVYTITRTAFFDDDSQVSFSRVVTVNSFSLESVKPDYEKVIYRYGETVEEGLQASEIDGVTFPFHSFGSQPLNVPDVTGVPRLVIFDADDRQFYEVTTIGGPEEVGRDVVWRDKCDINGENGLEYSSLISFRGVAGTFERYFIEMLSANIYTRAIPAERQGVGVVYDASGYPTGINADISIQADENDGEYAEALDISVPKHEIHFDRRVEGHIIQLISEINMAPHIVTGYNANLIYKDKLDAPGSRAQSSEEKQQDLSFLMTNWITRGNPSCDRITGLSIGVISAGEGVVGPDSFAGSSLEIVSGESLNFTNTETMRSVFWFRSGTIEGSLPVGYEVIESVGDWVFAQVLSADITFGEGVFFDIRVFVESELPSDFDTGARTYLYNDIVNYNGDNTLPAWL